MLSVTYKIDHVLNKNYREGRPTRVPVMTYAGKKAMSVYAEVLGEQHHYNRSRRLACV